MAEQLGLVLGTNLVAEQGGQGDARDADRHYDQHCGAEQQPQPQ